MSLKSNYSKERRRSTFGSCLSEEDNHYIRDIILPLVLKAQEPSNIAQQSLDTTAISTAPSIQKDDLKEKLSLYESKRSSLESRKLNECASMQTDNESEGSVDFAPTSTAIGSTNLSLTSDELRLDLGLSNDLLLHEKVDNDVLVEQTSVRLFDIIISDVKMLTIQASYAGVSLTWDLGSLVDVYALLDVSKFGQVMRNLISNAIKFTPKGGTVHVSAIKIAEPITPAILEPRSVFGDLACVSSKSLRRVPSSGTSVAPDPSLSLKSDACPVVVFSSKSFKGVVTQPSPPTAEMPSTMTRRPSLRLLSTHPVIDGKSNKLTSVVKQSSSNDPFAGSSKSHKNVAIQEQPVELPKPTLFRISVTDSGCGISQVWRLSLYT